MPRSDLPVHHWDAEASVRVDVDARARTMRTMAQHRLQSQARHRSLPTEQWV